MRGRSSTPLISVVIPTFNRAASLKKMLDAWERQDPDDLPFEVVVVDDGSQDDTQDVIENFRPLRFSLVRLVQENEGPAIARNHGLAASMGEWILFTGDDIEPAPDLLKSHLDAHNHLNDDRWAVLGNVSWPREIELTSTMRHVDGVGAQQFSYYYMEDGDEFDFRHFYTSNVSASRRLLNEEYAGFSGDFAAAAFEDAEFSYRLARRGMRIVYRASARAWHHHPYNVHSFFRRQISCGRMAAVLIGKWPRTRQILGAGEVTRCRILERLSFGAQREHLREVGRRLETLENGVLDFASKYDSPATSAVDPLLHSLFQYGYLEGLVTATMSEVLARRLCAYWLTNHVGRGVAKFSAELKKRGCEVEAASVLGVLDPVSN